MIRAFHTATVGPWSPWSSCSVTCGTGVVTRTRTCTERPRSGRGGQPPVPLCTGLTVGSQACSEAAFCPRKPRQTEINWIAFAFFSQPACARTIVESAAICRAKEFYAVVAEYNSNVVIRECKPLTVCPTGYSEAQAPTPCPTPSSDLCTDRVCEPRECPIFQPANARVESCTKRFVGYICRAHCNPGFQTADGFDQGLYF